jgi:hypothetical protein
LTGAVEVLNGNERPKIFNGMWIPGFRINSKARRDLRCFIKSHENVLGYEYAVSGQIYSRLPKDAKLIIKSQPDVAKTR